MSQNLDVSLALTNQEIQFYLSWFLFYFIYQFIPRKWRGKTKHLKRKVWFVLNSFLLFYECHICYKMKGLLNSFNFIILSFQFSLRSNVSFCWAKLKKFYLHYGYQFQKAEGKIESIRIISFMFSKARSASWVPTCSVDRRHHFWSKTHKNKERLLFIISIFFTAYSSFEDWIADGTILSK